MAHVVGVESVVFGSPKRLGERIHHGEGDISAVEARGGLSHLGVEQTTQPAGDK